MVVPLARIASGPRDMSTPINPAVAPAGRANTRSHADVSSGRSRNAANGGAYARAFRYGFQIASLVAFALDFSFGLVELFIRTSIESADSRFKLPRDAVGQGERVEANVELTAAVNAARTLYLCDRSRDIASGRDHDFAGSEDRINGFEIDAVALSGVLGADAVDQIERYAGAGTDRKLIRRRGWSGSRRCFWLFRRVLRAD